MSLMDDLLGCPLQQITCSYWAAKLNTGGDAAEWVSEARLSFDFRRGAHTPIDWMDDIVASGDHKRITELWLLCPPCKTSPLGNTARLPITRASSAFQFKIGMYDAPLAGPGIRTLQAHIIGRVDDSEGNCTCFIYDPILGGLLTPETQVYDPKTQGVLRDTQGNPVYAGKTNVNNFHSWRPSLAPPGRLAIDRIGVEL